jgi:hypothetical protein
MILPRQARDKHRGSTQKNGMRFLAGVYPPDLCELRRLDHFPLPVADVLRKGQDHKGTHHITSRHTTPHHQPKPSHDQLTADDSTSS